LGAAGASLRMRTKKAKWADMEGEDVMWVGRQWWSARGPYCRASPGTGSFCTV
jgi:hypothetical protein